MSELPIPPEDPILEDVRIRLREIVGASATTDDGAGLYVQQTAQAGLLALDALPSCPEAQQLAKTVVQEIDECYNLLRSLTHVDEGLENDLLDFLGAINQIQEASGLSDGSIIERLRSSEENIQELSARIVWRIVANDSSEVVTAAEEETGDVPSPPKLISQARDDSGPSSMPNILDNANPFPGIDPQDDSSLQSATDDERLAHHLQLEEYLGAAGVDTIAADHLPETSGSAVLTATGPGNRHRSETLSFGEIYQRGMDLLSLFMREGDIQNLFKAVSLLRASLLLCPSDPEHRITAARNLAVALLIQYEQKGAYSDLIEAITLERELLGFCPSGHPERAVSLEILSQALCTRYEREGNPSDLSEAIEHNREALNLHPSGHPGRASSLTNLSNTLWIRYQREGSLSDLLEAIEQYREALNLRPSGHPDRAMSLNNLSNALRTRYEREGNLSDLSEAIEKYREALCLYPSGHPDRGSSLSNLSSALCTQYEHSGSLSDLSEAIEHNREAVSLHPSDHPHRSFSLNNLSNALMDRYECEGSLSDLSEAIERYQEALSLRPPGHPDRGMSLNNLSTALHTRYECEGSLSDLSEAIEHNRGALSLRPSGHPDRGMSLNNLSATLCSRYEREGNLSDLSEAIEHNREALNLHPSGHPSRAVSLNNLSSALHTRYKCEGSLSDLSEALEQHREALNLRPPGHPVRASSLDNLSNTLRTRYERSGNFSDLSEAIDYSREALNIRPSGHPERGMTLSNLSTALSTRYKHEGSLSDLSEAIEHNREALSLHPFGHLDHTLSLNNLSSALIARYQHEGSLSDLSEAIEQYREALSLYPSGHPDRAMSLNNLPAALFFRYEREGNLSDLSEAIERHREALSLRPSGHPDRAMSLNNLSSALHARYECEGRLTDLSEAIEQYQEALGLHPSGHPDRGMSLSNLSNALFTRYKHEGILSDLSEAIEHKREALNLCPSGHPNRSFILAALCKVLLHTNARTTDNPDMALTCDVFEMLREAVDLPTCPPLHRLNAALQWIDTARQLDPQSMLSAYGAALDRLDLVLATSNSLKNKHTQLASSDVLARCRQLGVEAASYAVCEGRMTLAVEFLERGRNLLFAQIGRYRVDLEDLRRVSVELADRFSNLSNLLDASVVSNQPTLEGRTVFEDSSERYRRVSSSWSRAVDDIRAVEGFEHFLKPPSYAALRAVADEGPMIIVIPGRDQSDALIISQERDMPHHVTLPEAGEDKLVELVDMLVEAVHSDDDLATEESAKKILRLLWTRVVRPIAEVLENELHVPLHSRVWWCPTSFFSSLPLHAAGRYTSKHMMENLPDRYVSSYTPTLHALLRSRRNRGVSRGEKILVVAQPDTPGQSRLPNALPEAERVKELLETKMDSTLLSGEEGTHAAVLNDMPNHPWLHLTCHGIQNFNNPFQSCFCLHDGNLTLSDIMRRGLPDAKFAFLAACHTATGDPQLRDEGLHLAAGLQFAGFKSVIGTTWEVADLDGPAIAEAFYKTLQLEQSEKRGLDCSRAAYALSQAVKQLRENGVPISRWMHFIHIGI